jgi:hypothetical protein
VLVLRRWPRRSFLTAFEALLAQVEIAILLGVDVLLPGIAVRPSRPPVSSPRLARRDAAAFEERLGFGRRLPQLAAGIPAQEGIGMLAHQTFERREQLLALGGAKGRRKAVDENGPVGEARRHGQSTL